MVTTGSFESQDPVQGAGVVSRRRLVWAVIGLSLVGVLGLSVLGVAGPKPCTSCHDRQAFKAETQASAHASVECRRCHLAPGTVGDAIFAARWPFHAYLPPGRAADRDAAAVPDSRCRACHETVLESVVASNGIRMKHTSCATMSSCTDCHSATAHGRATRWVRSYEMDGCLGCHRELKNVGCDLCHKGQATAARVKSAAFAVTHGPAWRTTHGMGDSTTCIVCHTASDCGACHGVGVPHESGFVTVHATYAVQSEAKCASCHNDDFCNSCHGTAMPHPAGFTPRHMTDAKAQPDVCDRCHEKADCENCHVKHVHPGGAIGATVSEGGGR